jgi:hypothetical protein
LQHIVAVRFRFRDRLIKHRHNRRRVLAQSDAQLAVTPGFYPDATTIDRFDQEIVRTIVLSKKQILNAILLIHPAITDIDPVLTIRYAAPAFSSQCAELDHTQTIRIKNRINAVTGIDDISIRPGSAFEIIVAFTAGKRIVSAITIKMILNCRSGRIVCSIATEEITRRVGK